MMLQNISSNLLRRLGTLVLLCGLGLPGTTTADDTEVYVNPTTTPIAPNIMFVLDLSASMNKKPDGTTPGSGEQSRLDILKQAITDVLDSNLPDVNVGLTTFTHNRAGGIKFPVLPIDDEAHSYDANIPTGVTVGEAIKSMVAASTAQGFTPTVDQLYETALYFRGEVPYAPANNRLGTWNTGRGTYYDGGWGWPRGWRAANPISYTGDFYYAHPDDPGTPWNARHCKDYTAYNPSGVDECADERADGLLLKCDPRPPRVCTSTQCDSSCGTYDRCDDAFGNEIDLVWTIPTPNNCLTDSSNNIWVTRQTDGQDSRCCTSSDAGGSECLSHQNYDSTCPGTWNNYCRTNNNRAGYNYCWTGEGHNREYISPITQQCQKSAVVLLTDGDPSYNRFDYGLRNGDGTARSPWLVRKMIQNDPTAGDPDTVLCNDQSDEFGYAPWSHRYSNCGIELADFMYNENQRSSIEGSTIQTHTIGFGLAGAASTWEWLQRMANAGGGQAYQADNLTQLTQSFENVIASLTSGNQTFRNFSATFDVATLATGDRAYLSLFSPTETPSWQGNLKGYFLKNDGLYDIYDGIATELDNNGQVVFKPTAKSFWSNVVDGNSPASGGVVSTLNASQRNIYVITDPTEVANIDLDDGNHDFEIGNIALTDTLMGMPAGSTATERDDLIDYFRSERMGDPLHTRPHIVDYGNAAGSPGSVLYIGTNQGYLHAFDINRPTGPSDTGGGGELFAFLPNELLGSMHAQQSASTGDHIYGIDGPITIWRQDANGNGNIDGTDKVFLYFGMRRGGGAYYAMDVTDPDNPQLMWKIDSNVAGFSKLGQTWSKMTLADIKQGTTTRKALIFAGGYDEDQDDIGVVRTADDEGLGLYIVNAETGALIKSIGPDSTFGINGGNFTDMTYAVPSDVKVIDSNNNDIDDRVYVADMGGQVWRFDIKESGGYNSSGKFTGYKLADFGKDGLSAPTAQTNRRFFYPPSVARHTRGGQFVYAMSIGSGYRAHPLDDTIQDKLFVFFDENADSVPASAPTALTTAKLYDATADKITSGTAAEVTTATAAFADPNNKGWSIDLGAKEKVLSRTILFRNRVLFTSFLPEGTGGVCDVSSTTNRLYVLDLNNATGQFPVDSDNDGVVDSYERSQVVADQAMILDEPLIVTYHDPGDPNPSDPNAPPKPPSTCAGVYGGAQKMLTICSSPVKVNWSTVQ